MDIRRLLEKLSSADPTPGGEQCLCSGRNTFGVSHFDDGWTFVEERNNEGKRELEELRRQFPAFRGASFEPLKRMPNPMRSAESLSPSQGHRKRTPYPVESNSTGLSKSNFTPS
jgi:hypothetical protein